MVVWWVVWWAMWWGGRRPEAGFYFCTLVVTGRGRFKVRVKELYTLFFKRKEKSTLQTLKKNNIPSLY
jgi:hypothetical protein